MAVAILSHDPNLLAGHVTSCFFFKGFVAAAGL